MSGRYDFRGCAADRQGHHAAGCPGLRRERGMEAEVSLSDLDLDQLVHTPEGRLVIEVLQGRRLPLVIILADRGEVVFWYPESVKRNIETDSQAAGEWVRILEEHITQLQANGPKQ